MSHPFSLIVFDFDGTLADSQNGIVACMDKAFRGHGLPPPDAAAVRRIVGLKLEEGIARLLPEDTDWETAVRLADGYRDAFFEMRSRPDHREALFPGVREILTQLDEPHVCLGIATGKSRRGLEVSLDRHGLAHHFVTLQTADDGPGKPHPEILRKAMAETGVKAAQTVLIGDTTFDMELAANAGVRSIGVAWGYHEVEELMASGAACVIESFAELPSRLSNGLLAVGRERT